MQAIDEVERIRRAGRLTYYRSVGGPCHPAREVVEQVAVMLRTPDDPRNRCVGNVVIEWVRHFANGALAPRVKAEGGEAKMLALFPEILAPFFQMRHGSLTPDEYVQGLIGLGIVAEPRNFPFESGTTTCAHCRGLFAKDELESRPDREPVCKWCAAYQEQAACCDDDPFEMGPQLLAAH